MAAKKKGKKSRASPANERDEASRPSEKTANDAPPAKDVVRPRALRPLPPLPAPIEQPVPPSDLAFVDNPLAIAIVLALALALFVGLTWKSKPGASGGPLSAVPRESFLVGRVDVPTLRASPLYTTVMGDADASRTLGLDELARGCGFDPIARVKELVVAIPEGESRGTFGLAAQVTVTESELATCAQRISEARGVTTTPKAVGSFHVLEEQKGARPGLAFREGGLLLVAEGAWLSSMIAAADGPSSGGAKVDGKDLHGLLTAAITADPKLTSPTVLATAVLPRSLRERLRAELGEEIARATAAPGGEDTPQAIMSAVLSVAGAGVGVALGDPSGEVAARAELSCEDEASARVLGRIVERKRFAWSKDIALRLVGLGGAIDSITVEPRGTSLTVKLRASSSDLSRGIGRVLELGQKNRRASPTAPPLPSLAPERPRPPDEVVKPKGASSPIRPNVP